MPLTSVQDASLSEEQRDEDGGEKKRGGGKGKKKQLGDSEVSAVLGPLAFMAH